MKGESGMLISVVVGLLLAALGVFMLLSGRGSFLIAGFNTLSKEEKAKYNHTALSKFIGGVVLVPIGLLTVLLVVSLPLCDKHSVSSMWVVIPYCAITFSLCIFTAIYCNTGSRFRY